MNNQKILLIDYDPASITKTATPLTKAGYSVEVAKDGLSGLAAFERMKPALVLVEAMLPRKHGFEVCQEIKAKPGGKSTPVLITSAVCRGRKYRMDALQIYGCDEYVEKPIPDAELVSMIERLIDAAATATEDVKRDLSRAIDTVATDGPAAIDSMSDDELEAKIDSLLMGDELDSPFPATTTATSEPDPETPAAAPVATPVALVPEPTIAAEPAVETTSVEEPSDGTDSLEAEEDIQILATSDHTPVGPLTSPDQGQPVETVAVAEDTGSDLTVQSAAEAAGSRPIAEPTEDSAFDGKSEMERRVAAMVEVEPPSIDSPLIDPLPAADDKTDGDVFGENAATTDEQDALVADTETATPAKGGSKAILFGVAAVIVLGAVGFLAFQQGWIGAGSEPSAATPAIATETTTGNAPVAVEPKPEPVAATAIAQADTAANTVTDGNNVVDSAPPVVDPEPIKIARQAQPRPELPPEPKAFTGRTQAEKDAAAQRQREAEQALAAAAGSLQSSLLTNEFAEPTSAAGDDAQPVDVDLDLIGTPEPPKPLRGQLFDINEVDTIPVPKRFTQPVYDELARRMRQQGEILVSVLIDETGKVANVELIKPIPNSRLNGSTLTAARKWVYEPAIKAGVPVSVWKTERILFSLD
jgi:TonB family protein